MSAARPVAVRFWEKVQKGDAGACWPWTGFVARDGYGRLSIGGHFGRPVAAHRIAWKVTHGAIPDGLFVCHHCDNRVCVNPSHLFLGTPRDNTLDMYAKGRNAPLPKKAIRIPPDTVAAIRRRAAAGEAKKLLASEYGLSESYARRIARGTRRANG